ncbi:MAG TPA: antibiotic biosynthesis monooxygenase [Longimicrobiales bacterium]|nr:antibiotic biosynthesis monooxygenase [Longimicrobiales bacterium]
MVMTVLEAQVAADRADDLEAEFREVQVPPEILHTYLVRDARESTRYRIVTVWESQEALQAMRASGEKPKGVEMFEAVGAAAELSIFDIIAHHRPGS